MTSGRGQRWIAACVSAAALVSATVTGAEVTSAESPGIPANAVAAFFNLGAVVPDGHGHLTMWPCTSAADPVPNSSNLNYSPGTLRSNNTTTMLSADGSVCIYSHAGTDVILDATGYVLG